MEGFNTDNKSEPLLREGSDLPLREKGLEPSRAYTHKILSLACLPIPAFPRNKHLLIIFLLLKYLTSCIIT